MSLPQEYMVYPSRHAGLDHTRFETLYRERTALSLPKNAQLGVWVFVGLESFPLNPTGKPFLAPGAVTAPYPDLRNYTARDYGTRVGVYRLLSLFSQLGVRATFGVQGRIAESHPWLVSEISAGGHEVCAYGWDTDSLHSTACSEEVERANIERSLAALRAAGAAPTGWVSPARMESATTPDLIKAQGLGWIGDWTHDEAPTTFQTAHGPLVAMPFAQDLDDWTLLIDMKRPDEEWAVQVGDASRRLLEDAERFGPQILSLSLRPYVMGQPFRIAILRESLSALLSTTGVEFVTAEEVVSHYSPPSF